MTEPVTVRIGGETIALPPLLNFAALKRVWPAMRALDTTADPVEQTAARIAIVAGALLPTRPDLTGPEIEKRLRINLFDGTDEVAGLAAAVHELLVASGLIREAAATGEAQPAADAATIQTSNTSSPN